MFLKNYTFTDWAIRCCSNWAEVDGWCRDLSRVVVKIVRAFGEIVRVIDRSSPSSSRPAASPHWIIIKIVGAFSEIVRAIIRVQ